VGNPYPAEFWGPSRDSRALVVRLGGYVNFTDNSNQPGVGSVIVTDGVHTVSPASEILFVGATVADEGSGVAQVTVTGGGGGAVALSSYSFAYNTAGLAAGADTGIAAVSGKSVLAVWAIIPTPWNGTSPFADIGVGASTTGVNLAAFGSNPSLSNADWADGGAVGNTAGWVYPFNWTSSGNIKIWVTQNGMKNGASPGASQGQATIYILQTT
jgi:hypothetical protein